MARGPPRGSVRRGPRSWRRSPLHHRWVTPGCRHPSGMNLAGGPQVSSRWGDAATSRSPYRRTAIEPADHCQEPAMPDHYDVIVIGTGAGGGTLAHTLAAVGQADPAVGTGQLPPRETQNWESKEVFLEGRYISPDTWYDADGTAFQPQVHYFVGGATKLYGAALYRLRPQDFGEIKHADGMSPAWPRLLRRLRAVVHQGGVAVPGARHPRRRSDRGCTGRSSTRGRRSPTSRASRRSSTTWRPPGTTRSRRRAASCSTRPTGPGARASVARGATAIRAWCTPSPTPRRSPCGRC